MNTRMSIGVVGLFLIMGASSAFALSSGTDVLVPAAGRGAGQEGSMWITDLSVLNIDGQTASVEVFWLSRNVANPSPPSATFSLAPGAALVLEDVIFETFGMDSAGGAFRVVADTEVAVASRIYNLQDSATFGQGFEGIPRLEAVAAGDSTDVASLREDSGFRTNIMLIDASDTPGGSTAELSLRDENGTEIAAETVELRRLEPKLFPVTDIASSTFSYATLHVEVTVGSVIVAASKVDNDADTGDPTTLEAWTSGATVDGTYKFAIWDSMFFATGGDLRIENGVVNSITGTYNNFDKINGEGDPECTLLFQFGAGFEGASVEDFEAGVEFTDTYSEGEMSWRITFTVDDSLGLVGTIEAEGDGFAGVDVGCNGSFPDLTFEAGKEK